MMIGWKSSSLEMFMKKNCDKQNNNHSSVQHLDKRVENQITKKESKDYKQMSHKKKFEQSEWTICCI